VLTHVQAGWQQTVAIENIGLGGARVVVENALALGDGVSLSFTAPTLWDPLVLRGRVAWVAPLANASGSRAAGVAFEHKSTDAVFALYELIVTLGYE
jgi:Tfp pilus assembly protein PilZ